MKMLKIVGSVLLIGFISFILWMNLTPGYFQYQKKYCDPDVIYISDNDNSLIIESKPLTINGIAVAFPPCEVTFISVKIRLIREAKLLLAKLDFNR